VHESKLKRWIEKYIIMDDVKLNKLNNKYVLFELLGPQADSFMTLVCGRAVNELGINKFKLINTDGLSFYTLKFIDKNGGVKFWLLSSIEHGAGLVNYMLNNKGIFDFKLIGEDAYNCYRISSGIPAAPNELNDLYNPHEAGLIDLVNFKKGCYIGQEVIARLDTYDKVQKFLKGVLFLEPVAMNLPFELFDESGNEAGNVTSIAFSPKYGNQIGLAYLKKAFIQQTRASTEQIEPFLYTKSINGSKIKVKIEDLPFNHGRVGLPVGQVGLPAPQGTSGQAG
jgi:folate-binding protein YgfZ